MHEPVPLSLIQESVLEFLRNRDDVVLFGAQAVNAYVDPPRMSQDVDVMALSAELLANEICTRLHKQFEVAVRVRSLSSGQAFRDYQVRKPKNRHLVYVRQTVSLPASQSIEQIQVATPAELIRQKVISSLNRSRTAKGLTDLADLRRLLLAFPELKREHGEISSALYASNASAEVQMAWQKIVAEEIEPEDDDSGY